MENVDRQPIRLPKGFNPDNPAHVAKVAASVEAKRGPGWSLESVDTQTQTAQFVRISAAAVVTDGPSGDIKQVTLPAGTKDSDGPKRAATFRETYPGFEMTSFDPHNRVAILKRLAPDVRRVREAVANELRLKEWDVQVAPRRGGGYSVGLGAHYSPAKDQGKLDEIAQTVAGAPGWYVRASSTSHGWVAEMIPAELPVFEPVYPFDFSALPKDASGLSDKERLTLPLGVELGGNGKPNRPLSIDLNDSVGNLIVGLAGSGKSVTTQAIIFSALAKGFDIALINTSDKATDFAWAKPYVADHMWGCDSVAQAVTVAKLVGEEGERRGALLSSHGVSKWQDLPDYEKKAHPPLLLVADELAALLTADKLPPGLSKEMKEMPEFIQMQQDILESSLLVTALGKVPAVYRAAGIRVVYLTQQPNERYGFSTKLKGNLPHRIMLGTNPSQAEKGHAFRTPEQVPDVPSNIAHDAAQARGVGLAHMDGKSPAIIKGYFAPLDTYIAECKRRGFEVTSKPEPTAAQIAAMVPQVGGDDDFDDEPEGIKARREALPDPMLTVAPELAEVFDVNGNAPQGAARAAMQSAVLARKRKKIDADNA